MKLKLIIYYFALLAILQLSNFGLFAHNSKAQNSFDGACSKIESLINNSNIPGLSFVFVDSTNVYIKNWGYADLKSKVPVTSQTLFEIGSNSKAFTGLAILKMEEDGLLNLKDNVSKYISWFKTFYNSKEVNITIEELIHQTSGIPTETVSKIPCGESVDMLERTVRTINNLELKSLPGTEFEYATINYDILGLIIQNVSKISFEEYMQQNIFQALQLNSTTVGKPVNNNLSMGYKIGFFSPRIYDAPRFKGNNPAGYVISNAEDIVKWIKYQLEIDSCSLESIIRKSHIPDLTVAPLGHSSYASGWNVNPYGEKTIFHSANNPNFTSYIGLIPGKKQGIAILANSNSDYTLYLGTVIIKTLNNEDVSELAAPDTNTDKVFSLISIILLFFIVGILILFVWVIKGAILKQRRLVNVSWKFLIAIVNSLVLTIPFIYGVYLLPKAIMGFTWESIVIWAPPSLLVACILFSCGVLGIWVLSVISTIVPTKNKYYKSLPMIIILSIMSGLANMALILILINAIESEAKIIYLLFYFTLILAFYITSRKVVQTKLIKISLLIVYDLRMRLINKIFLSSYCKYEKIDNGRIYATLTQDTYTISNSVNILITLVSNFITIIGVFIYLGTLSFTATLFIFVVIVAVAALYYRVSNKTNVLFEQARDSANVFSGLIDGLLYGFKELSLSGLKKKEYTNEIEASCSELEKKSGKALIKFINAYLIGETLLIMILGSISFAIPVIFPQIPNYKLVGFIMIILYLIGPINAVLNSIPNIMLLKVSWRRIKSFIDEIEPDLKLTDIITNNIEKIKVGKLSVKGLMFKYKYDKEEREFGVGPINLDIKSGEILFIIGGNGSGKSTLANLLTGLYIGDEGEILINDNKVENKDLGNLYSTIFSNHHIFKKLYGINTNDKKEELDYLFKLLRLEEKVDIEEGSFSTIELSNGQRKRLSLMKAFLEDSQIYLFDEWAADQDPEYKKVFYHKLLPEMKKKGKIVIAITHDDNYFDVADRIIKMDMGKMVDFEEKSKIEEFVS